MSFVSFVYQYFEHPTLLLWALPVLVALFLLLVIPLGRFSGDRALLRRRKLTLFFTRGAILLCLLIALASPFLTREQLARGDEKITLLADNSTSFTLFDTGTAQRVEEQLSNIIKVTKHSFGDTSKTPLSDVLLEQLQENTNLLLVTDGYNTIGPALSTVLLQASKVNASIHAVKLTPQQKDSSLVITGPDKVSSGVKNLFTVAVQSTGDKQARRVVIEVDGAPVFDQYTSEMEIPVAQSFSDGIHHITATLHDQDHFPENNKYYKTVKVIKKPEIIFYTLQESPLVPLLSQLYEVTIVDRLTATLDASKYYAVLVNDIPAEQLAGAIPVLKQYLSDDNGVFFVGGDTSFDKGGYKKTALEELLPGFVAVAEEKDEGIVNIVIAMDVSRSTAESYGSGSVAGVEKALALSILSNIKDSSQVGFIAFDDRVHIVSAISPLGDKRDDLLEKVKSLKKIGSDSYLPSGLEGGIKMLEGVSGGKNLIFISDGKSGGFGHARSLALAAQEQGIKLYGVGVGERDACVRYNARGECVIKPSDIYGIDAVKNIAVAGGGFYFTGEKSPQKVKALFGASEQGEEKDIYTVTVLDENHFITQHLEINAQVTGFNTVIPKKTASLLATTDSGEPLLLVWRYGVGRVATLATDDGSVWATDLLSNKNSLLLTKTLNWLIGDPERKNEQYVSIPDTNLQRSTEVTVKAKQQPVAEGLTFYKRDTNLYTAPLTPTTLGFHQLLGTEYAVNYNKELEEIGFNPQLADLVQASGGQLFEEKNIHDIIAVLKTQADRPVFKQQYYRWPFVLLAIVVFLFELLLRRSGR